MLIINIDHYIVVLHWPLKELRDLEGSEKRVRRDKILAGKLPEKSRRWHTSGQNVVFGVQFQLDWKTKIPNNN